MPNILKGNLEKMISESEVKADFKPVSFEDIKLICSYLKKANYKESNHNIINMLIWINWYPLFMYKEDNYLLLLGIHEGEFFVYMPLCEKPYFKEAILKAKEIFGQHNQMFVLSCFTKEMMNMVLEIFPNYKACEARDSYDYVYETESFRTFGGKKLQKKRNHLNFFYKEYNDRYSYEAMNKDNAIECIEFLEKWKTDVDDTFMIEERRGVKKVLELFDQLPYVGGIIRIDNKVEGFVIGSKLTEDMCQENVEKANDEYRGIYQALIQQFFIHEFTDVKYVNREDDLGYENLRQAKLAYNPVFMIEKYRLCRGDECEGSQS